MVKLYGSMEIAPKLGLTDAIVDLVDTGRTLSENGLQECETIATISARLIANKALMKMYHDPMHAMVEYLRQLKTAH